MLVKQLLSMKHDAAKPWIEAGTIVTIRPEVTLAEAAKLLAEKRIGAAVVSEDGRTPVGILSERDVVRQLGNNGIQVLEQPISEVMTRSVQTCAPGDDAMTVLERMTEGRFRHMPVIDDDGFMLGVVSIGDAVSGRLKELAAEKDALTGMIMGN
ncbi:CBS domain-containing protein [Paracoccus sp. 1_MG-2023]|uniref:CBS domain-containing protein n=1 Tax=unclassified Paracoccus (in: a-proteobacteria) TaxID=2688777 RepID=UPI001C09CEF8|nr:MULTISPECIES: CBS domain-containing protein [unclassified Paracoccus (in: a-proteobacteria)]MBU2959041.1 CBS domain-containing protein [Paracoccus sp. C2R09]MDO6669014.1 CBS domain-containing protein [Paracoccus sp. 1_MG-2023]